MPTDQTTLVPSFILHLNGRRLEVEDEYSVQTIKVIDSLNDLAKAAVTFSDPEMRLQSIQDFNIGSEITITMGYKDDVTTIFKGDIVGDSITLCRNKSTSYTINALNHLHKLKRKISQTSFNEMNDSQIIQQIADNAGLSVLIEDFGTIKTVFVNPFLTDFELLKHLAEYNGYDFFLRDDNLYVEKHSAQSDSDIILEWGKSLEECRSSINISGQISHTAVASCNPITAEGFTSEVDNSQIQGDGPALAKEFLGLRSDMIFEEGLESETEAEKRAETLLINRARQFNQVSGSCEGNTDIMAGEVVQLKEIGERLSIKYLVESVIHTLKPDKGYKTEFSLVSNVGSPDGRPAGSSQSNDSEAAQEQGSSEEEAAPSSSSGGTAQAEEESTEEKTPEITSLNWKDESGKTISSAHIGQKVLLTAQVKNINNGESLSLKLLEKDSQGEDDSIFTKSVTIQNGKIEYEWNVEYVNDDDDISSESEEGYSMPEYVFTAETSDGSCKSEESPLCEVKSWLKTRLIDDETNEVLKQTQYTLICKDGSTREGKTDDRGFLKEMNLPCQDHIIIIKKD